MQADKCSSCKEYAMPKAAPDSQVTARRCQACGFIEEINRNDQKLGNQPMEPERNVTVHND